MGQGIILVCLSSPKDEKILAAWHSRGGSSAREIEQGSWTLCSPLRGSMTLTMIVCDVAFLTYLPVRTRRKKTQHTGEMPAHVAEVAMAFPARIVNHRRGRA